MHRIIYHVHRSERRALSTKLEALLFASGDPLSIEDLSRLTDLAPQVLEKALDELERFYQEHQRGLVLKRLNDRYTLSTHPEHVDVLKNLFTDPPSQRLSSAAYEVLAVIAYNQPVTRAQIDQVRGVSSDGPLNRLLEQGLIDEVGHLDLPGRPTLFGTTELFLKVCGLSTAQDLPPEELLMYDSLQALEQKLRELEGEPHQLSFGDQAEPLEESET